MKPWTLVGMQSERGATLINVAISILILMGLLAFVLDFGVLWLARGQAQNAADAAAHAGAVARAYDEPLEPPASGGPTETAALQAAYANHVFGQAPGVVLSWECPPWYDASTRCVRADVFRDGTNGSTALPVYFAKLLGADTQGVRATATAVAIPANATDCLRPWAIADKWAEAHDPAWSFDRYYTNGPDRGRLVLPAPQDWYVAPTDVDPGTGYQADAAHDLGTHLQLHFTAENTDAVNRGWFRAVDIPREDDTSPTGAARYEENIRSCNGIAMQIGQYLNTEPGRMAGPTRQGAAALVALDPYAQWDGENDTVINSCAPSPACGPQSPRIVAIAAFDPDLFQKSYADNDFSYCGSGRKCLKVTNIFGFFIDAVVGDDVWGYLMNEQGIRVPGGWSVGQPSAFLWTIQLRR